MSNSLEINQTLESKESYKSLFKESLLNRFGTVVTSFSTLEQNTENKLERQSVIRGGLKTGRAVVSALSENNFVEAGNIAKKFGKAGLDGLGRVFATKLNRGSSDKENFGEVSRFNFQKAIGGLVDFVQAQVENSSTTEIAVEQIIDKLSKLPKKDTRDGFSVILASLMEQKNPGQIVRVEDIKKVLDGGDTQNLKSLLSEIIDQAKISAEIFSKNPEAAIYIPRNAQGLPELVGASRVLGPLASIGSFVSRRVIFNPFLLSLGLNPFLAALGTAGLFLSAQRITREQVLDATRTVETLELSGFTSEQVATKFAKMQQQTLSLIGAGDETIRGKVLQILNIANQTLGLNFEMKNGVFADSSSTMALALQAVEKSLSLEQNSNSEDSLNSALLKNIILTANLSPEDTEQVKQAVENQANKPLKSGSQIVANIKTFFKNWTDQAIAEKTTKAKYAALGVNKDLSLEQREIEFDKLRAYDAHALQMANFVTRPDIVLKFLINLASILGVSAGIGGLIKLCLEAGDLVGSLASSSSNTNLLVSQSTQEKFYDNSGTKEDPSGKGGNKSGFPVDSESRPTNEPINSEETWAKNSSEQPKARIRQASTILPQEEIPNNHQELARLKKGEVRKTETSTDSKYKKIPDTESLELSRLREIPFSKIVVIENPSGRKTNLEAFIARKKEEAYIKVNKPNLRNIEVTPQTKGCVSKLSPLEVEVDKYTKDVIAVFNESIGGGTQIIIGGKKFYIVGFGYDSSIYANKQAIRDLGTPAFGVFVGYSDRYALRLLTTAKGDNNYQWAIIHTSDKFQENPSVANSAAARARIIPIKVTNNPKIVLPEPECANDDYRVKLEPANVEGPKSSKNLLTKASEFIFGEPANAAPVKLTFPEAATPTRGNIGSADLNPATGEITTVTHVVRKLGENELDRVIHIPKDKFPKDVLITPLSNDDYPSLVLTTDHLENMSIGDLRGESR